MTNTRTLDEAAAILGIDPATLYRKRKSCKLNSMPRAGILPEQKGRDRLSAYPVSRRRVARLVSRALSHMGGGALAVQPRGIFAHARASRKRSVIGVRISAVLIGMQSLEMSNRWVAIPSTVQIVVYHRFPQSWSSRKMRKFHVSSDIRSVCQGVARRELRGACYESSISHPSNFPTPSRMEANRPPDQKPLPRNTRRRLRSHDRRTGELAMRTR